MAQDDPDLTSPKELSDPDQSGAVPELTDEGSEPLLPDERPALRTKEEIANVIQALAFAAGEVLTLKRLRAVMGDFVDAALVQESLVLVNERLNSIASPFELVESGGGYRFRTRSSFAPWVRALLAPDGLARRLSQAALETVSIIAYKQPITKSEIEAIRCVSCDGPIKSLLDRKLVALGPRAETLGSPFQYVTTKEFLKYFGINRIPEDLPRMNELEELIHANELLPQFDRAGHMFIPSRDGNPAQLEMSMGE